MVKPGVHIAGCKCSASERRTSPKVFSEDTIGDRELPSSLNDALPFLIPCQFCDYGFWVEWTWPFCYGNNIFLITSILLWLYVLRWDISCGFLYWKFIKLLRKGKKGCYVLWFLLFLFFESIISFGSNCRKHIGST